MGTKESMEGRRDVSRGFTWLDKASTATYDYYGYQNIFGGWMIIRIKNDDSEARYAFGNSNYATAWTNRVSQEYTLLVTG